MSRMDGEATDMSRMDGEDDSTGGFHFLPTLVFPSGFWRIPASP
jgi:hypothetical protein